MQLGEIMTPRVVTVASDEYALQAERAPSMSQAERQLPRAAKRAIGRAGARSSQ